MDIMLEYRKKEETHVKLFIKQEVFSARDYFLVKDEMGNDIYEVRAPETAIIVGLKLHIRDMQGHELAFIDQKGFALQPTFRVHKRGEHVATVAKKFTMLKPKYEVKELGWTVQGDFLAHQYTITSEKGLVMSIEKQFLSFGDAFAVDLRDEAHVMEALAVVFAIDSVMDRDQADGRLNGIKLN